MSHESDKTSPQGHNRSNTNQAGDHVAWNQLTCDRFEDRINDVLDLRLALKNDAALMAHAAVCQECDQILQEYVAVDDSMKLLQNDLAEILEVGNQDVRANDRGRHRAIGVLMAAAAVLLVCIGIGQWAQPTNRLLPPLALADVVTGAAVVTSTEHGRSLEDRPAESDASILVQQQRLAPRRVGFDLNMFSAVALTRVSTDRQAWNQFCSPFNALEPVIEYSSELPLVRPMRATISATLEMLRRAFQGSDGGTNPDLGRYFESGVMLAAIG